MDQYRVLGDKLRQLSPKQTPLYQGVVRAVEGLTCTVEVDGLEIPDVRLRATTSDEDEELLITPAIGSGVVVGSLTGDIADLVVLSIDRAESIVINGGHLGGLVIVGKLTQKLNALEEDINNLKKVFVSWVTVPNDGGASLKTSVGSWAGKTITKTQESDLANTKIKQ